ncbi:MAG: Cna B-type domain-containing protein, partial [Erysipelotrichaceae bacterium]|nr:Cna B-type domain-containing protein [Erysipelotrichaceae bacterium]
MKKKLLTIALSFLMIFNCLPSGPLTVVSAEGEEIEETEILETPETTEISEDYEIPVDETEEVSEEDPGVIEEPVETGDPVIHEEPTEDPSEDPFVDYVKTEDEDVFSLTLHGEAAEDPAAAEEFILEHTDLKIEEVKEVVATLFADPQNDAPEETRASEADGTKIIGITTKWITPDTVDNDDDSLLYVKPADASDQTVKLQINYSLAGEHDYEAGDVRIKIPAEIFWGRPDENGKRDPLGTMVLPFPEAPDTSSDFNYEFIEDKVNGNYYLLTNTKKMEAATKGHIRIAFTDLSPYDVVDMQESDPFDAEIFVKVHTGKTISLGSNAITAQFDTEAKVVPGSGSKRVKDKIIIVGPDSIPSKQRIDGEEAYVLVKYYAWATIEANTRYTLSVRDFIPDEFGGFVLNATSADGREKDNGVVYEGTKNGKTVYYWFTVAYPVSKFTPDVEVTLHNNVEFKVTEVDPESTVANPNVQDPDPQLVTIEIAPCNPHYTYRLPTWVDPPGHYNIWKNGNDGKAKGNITRAVNAADTDRTRSDLLIGTSGYYGIYPSALNDLQDGKDVEVSYTVDTLGYVFPWTYKEVTPGTGHEEADGTWVWDIPAARIISNYLQRKVKMETVDMGTRLERYGDMLKVGTDYEFVSLEFPNPRIYKGEPHNINPDGSWQALSYDDGTFLYTQDSDLTKVPVYNVEIMRNGVWEPYATVSWESGSRVITKTDGTVVSGSVLDLPAGTENWRNIIVTEKIAAIWYDIRVVIRFKPSATVMAAVDHQFEVTTTPRLDFWNNADLIATREDTGELIVDIKDIPTQGGHPKDGFNELDGYTTDTEVYPYKEAEQNIKDIDFSTNTINIKYSARVEVNSVIKEKRSFEQAIADGRLDVATHGYWYDLLPEGVRYKEGTVKVRDGDQIVDVYPRMVEHNGVKRQMLVVEVNLTPTPVRYQEGDTFYYQDVPTIEFWAEYSLDNMSAYGDTIHNVIAFEADLDEFGTIENYRGEPDDPTLTNHNNIATEPAFDNDGEKQMMKNLDPDRDTPSFVYAGVYTTIDEVDATRTYLRKDVDVNGENNYTSGIYYDNPEKNRRDVYEGGNYSYRLLFGNNDETISSNIRLFDSLETFHAAQGNDDIDIDKPVWKGTFNGVDVHNLVEKGCEPEVYYATENLPLEIPDPAAATGIKWHPTNTNLKDTSIWTNAKNYTGDLADVKMVAIDATKKADGSDFELQPDDSFMVYINMIAPSGEEARRLIAENGHAYNNSYMQASARAYSAQNPEFTEMYVRQDYTKVGMIEHKLTVEKEWDDQNNRDGLRPVNVVFHLLANKVDTGKTLTLPIIDEEGNKVWVGYFDNIPYADANGPIRYSVTEDFIDAYTGELIKENDQTFKFVNRHEPEKINVPGLKTWVGDDPTKRPSTLTIHLFADGVEIQKKNVKADPDTGEWNYVFEGLYKYKEGEVRVPIVYTVTEEVTGLVSSYVPEYNGMNIINRYHPYGDLYLEKEISNLADILNNAAAINKTFEFNFEFVKKVDGEDVPIDTNYEYDILEGDTVVSSGWIGVDYTWSISIRYDQKIHVKEIDENAHYTITETNGKGFRLITSSGAAGVVLPNQTSNAKFVNEYKAKGHASLKAVKRLDCGIMEADQFSFTVYGEDGSVVKTTTNRDIEVVYNEDGSVSYSVSPVNFSTINYTEKDAGKTYRYKIVEAVKTDGTDGIIFDRTEFFAVVTVEDKEGNGELDVQVKYYDADGNELQDITFENEYRAEGKKVLTAWKVLQGRDLKDEEFTFELLAPNEKGIWEVIDSATNHGSIVSFKELEFNQNDNGKTFYYLVREVKGNDDTVVYDEGYFGYKLTVTDTSHGTLNIEQTMVDPDTIERGEKDEIINVTWKDGEGSMPVFRNALLPGILRIVKYIDPESEDYDPDQEFTFHVELTGTDLPDDQLPYTVTKLDSQFPPVEEPIGPVFPGKASNGNTVDGANPLLGNNVDAKPLAGSARRLNSETYHATDEELTGTAYAVLDADGNLIFFRSNEEYTAGADKMVTDIKGNTYFGTVYTGFENTDEYWSIWNKSSVKTITVAEGQAIRPVSLVCYYRRGNNRSWQSTYFCDMGNLVKADLSRFDTSLVTNLQYMFRNCSKLEELDLSTWDVSNVTDGMGTYEGPSIQTANGQSYVFRGCTSLEKLDISNWNPNAGYYSNLFANLTNLTELKLENVHFHGDGWAPFLFANLKSLEVLDLSTFYLDRGGRWANHTGIFQGSVFKEFSINSSFRFVQADDNFYTNRPAPALPTPTGEGYSGRWVKKYEDSAAYSPGGFPWSFNNDSVGMAGTWVWESDIFTVSFVADNAVGSMNDQMFSAIKNCKLPANQYVRFGYEFDHWVDEENGYEYEDTGMIPKDRYKMGDHIILKAVFKEIETHVDVSDGSFDITLKGGEMATIYNLPAGTSYNVTEIDIPDGWSLVGVRDNSGVIDSFKTITAYFTDKYSPNIATAQIHGMKLLDGRPAEPYVYHFRMTADNETEVALAGGRFEDTLFMPFDIWAQEGGHLNFPIFLYKEPGVHTYRIREIAPNDNNVIWDSHEEVVTVTVFERDGNLVADIKYDDDGFVFYNKTRPGELRIHKLGNVDENTKDDEFTFKVTFTDSTGFPLKDGEVFNWYVEGRTEEVPAANGEIVDHEDKDTGDIDPSGKIIGSFDKPAVHLNAYNEPIADNEAVLTFNGNGGYLNYNGEEVEEYSRKYDSTSYYIYTPGPWDARRDGYALVGWTTEPDGSGARYDAGYSIRPGNLLVLGQEVILYAQWAETADVTIKHYKQNDTLDGYTLADTVVEKGIIGEKFTGEIMDQYRNPDYYGYETRGEKVIVVSEDPSENVIEYQYNVVSYAIHFDGNGADSGDMEDIRVLMKEGRGLTPNNYKRDGYLFLGWNTAADGNGNSYKDAQYVEGLSDTPGAHVTLYAQWQEAEETKTKDGAIYVKCKAGETVVIPNIKQGTNYSVEEIELPENWVLERIENQTGTIKGEEAVDVYVTNKHTYKPAYVSLIAYKNLIGREIKEGEFTFELT